MDDLIDVRDCRAISSYFRWDEAATRYEVAENSRAAHASEVKREAIFADFQGRLKSRAEERVAPPVA